MESITSDQGRIYDDGAAESAATGPTVLYAVTIFVSATLLFLIQPMFAKIVLPLLGGTPAV